MKKFLYFLILLVTTVIMTSCNQSTNANKNIVYTSIYPIQYIVEEIGGDTLTVESVYPPGVDAHSYEPSSREMTQIARGKAFIYLGAGMESFAETAADSLKSQHVRLIEIAALDESLFSKMNDHEEHGHDHGDKDPHIWFDPLRMIKVGKLVEEQLSDIFPENAEAFHSNFETFKENMSDLDDEFTQTLAPKKNKEILVAHAAYSYWEERYGIEQLAISGLSTNDEPSQKDLTRIIRAAEESNLDYVIFEQTGTDKVSEIIREQLKAEPLYMHNLESLTEDDMENEENYLTLMKKNLHVLDKATN